MQGDLRVSKVAPQVEDNLTQLVDMVKQMGRKGDLTESQNRRMVVCATNDQQRTNELKLHNDNNGRVGT
jgi:hypothetical protein